MICPPFLRNGDNVAVISPSYAVTRDEVAGSIQVLESWGLKVREEKHAYGRLNMFSGTDDERLADLQMALDDDTIKAIFFTRGGYGLMRIIDKISWKKFLAAPKWIIGYSDITVLHSCLGKMGVKTIHGPMLRSFPENQNDSVLRLLRSLLFGLPVRYEVTGNSSGNNSSGVLCGGNLSLIYGLRGTRFDYLPEKAILFLEDTGEFLYHIDRMVQNIRLSEWSDKISGIILGDFSEMKDKEPPFIHTVNEIFLNLNIPVYTGFPAGHAEINTPMVFGSEVELISGKDQWTMRYKT
jgi:muramoyltetrapeptide carboxypeptidase